MPYQFGPYGGAPGPGQTYTQSFTEVLASTSGQIKMPGGVMLAQGFGVVVKGRVLGKITASSKFAPYTNTTLSAAAAAGATTVTLTDASAFVVGDNVLIGTDAAKSIVAINGNTITLNAALVAAQAQGSSVTTNDGRSVPVLINDNDVDTTNSDMPASAWIAGVFFGSALAGLDANAKAHNNLRLCYFV